MRLYFWSYGYRLFWQNAMTEGLAISMVTCTLLTLD